MTLIHHFPLAGRQSSPRMCNVRLRRQTTKLLRSFLRVPSALYVERGTIWLWSAGVSCPYSFLSPSPGVLTDRAAEEILTVQALVSNNGNVPVLSMLFLAQIQTQPRKCCHGYSCAWNETQQTTAISLCQGLGAAVMGVFGD